MGEGEYTEGPWRVVEHGWEQTSVYADGRPSPVCTLTLPEGGEDQTEAEARQSADARLIAAAPDLLAALREASHELRMNGFYTMADRYDALIAKANGEG